MERRTCSIQGGFKRNCWPGGLARCAPGLGHTSTAYTELTHTRTCGPRNLLPGLCLQVPRILQRLCQLWEHTQARLTSAWYAHSHTEWSPTPAQLSKAGIGGDPHHGEGKLPAAIQMESEAFLSFPASSPHIPHPTLKVTGQGVRLLE